jgi:hypothetical protein
MAFPSKGNMRQNMKAQNGKGSKTNRNTAAVRYLSCQVEPGMFDGEYLVSFEAADLQHPEQRIPVRLLADELDVKIQSGTPVRHSPAEGLLRVEVVERTKGLALLILPQPGQPVGERAYVDEDQLVLAGANS